MNLTQRLGIHRGRDSVLRRFMLRAALLLALFSLASVIGPRPVAAQLAGGLNLSLTPQPSSVAVGQAVTFSYTATPPAVAPPFPTITSLSIDFGDGASQALALTGATGQVSGSISHTYSTAGSSTATLSATASNGGSNTTTATITISGQGGQCSPPTVTVSAAPQTAAPGQSVAFSYSAVAGNGCTMATAPLPTLLINFGDGTSPLPLTDLPSGSINHTYNSPGTYQVTVSATSGAQTGVGQTSVTVTSGGSPSQPGTQVVYNTGWNLIGVPDGTVLPPTDALFTWQASAGSYTAATTTQAGTGYWASFPGQSNALFLPTTSPSAPPARITLPAGQWVMIGNPFSTTATVSGADTVFAYDPMSGYRAGTTLAPGLGAWAISATGGTAVIAPVSLR